MNPSRLGAELPADVDERVGSDLPASRDGAAGVKTRAADLLGSAGATIMWQDRIFLDPAVLVGKPVIKGTRLAVEFILDLLAEGWSHEQILGSYPQLTADDIRAVLRYAAETVKRERLYPLAV